MKKINIKVGMSYILDRGCIVANIDDGDNCTVITKMIHAKSSNKSLMLGIAEILEDVKDNSEVEILIQTNFGFRYLKNRKTWCDREEGDVLLDVINRKNIKYTFVDCSETNILNEYKEKARLIIRKEMRRIRSLMPMQRIDTSWFDLEGTEEKIVKDVVEEAKEIKKIEEELINNLNNLNEKFKVEKRAKIDMFVRASMNSSNSSRPGKYVSVLSCRGIEKEIYGFGRKTTTNRMILIGVIESIRRLKCPCDISLYTHTNVGLETKSKANPDLIGVIDRLVVENGHELICNVSDFRQEELSLKLKKIKM